MQRFVIGAVLVLASLVIAAPAKALRPGGYVNCWTCKYTTTQYITVFIYTTAQCVTPESGGVGWGLYCRVVNTMDWGFTSTDDCEFAGGECLYIEVIGRNNTGGASRDVLAAAKCLSSKNAVYLF